MPTHKPAKRGRKAGPNGKLVPIGMLFVSKARAKYMRAKFRLDGLTVSQQAAAALDKADPIPQQESGSASA